jgi:flavodoxin
MKIGLIIYSHTGNTYSVAEKLTGRLTEKGHNAELIRLKAEGVKKDIAVKNSTDLSAFDAYVFASPVQAFALAQPMAAYLEEVMAVTGKKAAVFITQQMKKPFFGGNSAIKKMTKILNGKGVDIVGSATIGWSNINREELIEKAVDYLAGLF